MVNYEGGNFDPFIFVHNSLLNVFRQGYCAL